MVIDEEVRTKMQEWLMPPVEVGQPVQWYPNGKRNSPNVEIGFCEKVSHTGRSIHVRRANGTIYGPMRHVEDPKLLFGEGHRDMGAWGYTDYDLQVKERIARLELMVTANHVGHNKIKAVAVALGFDGNIGATSKAELVKFILDQQSRVLFLDRIRAANRMPPIPLDKIFRDFDPTVLEPEEIELTTPDNQKKSGEAESGSELEPEPQKSGGRK